MEFGREESPMKLTELTACQKLPELVKTGLYPLIHDRQCNGAEHFWSSFILICGAQVQFRHRSLLPIAEFLNKVARPKTGLEYRVLD